MIQRVFGPKSILIPISGSGSVDAGPQQWRGVISVAYVSRSELQEAVQRLEQLKRQAGMAGEFQV